MVSMLSFDFTSAGESETLLCAGFGFHCRHYFTVFNKLDFIEQIILCFLLVLFWRNHHHHLLAFKLRHRFGLAVIEQRLGKLKHLGFTLLLVNDGATAEKDFNLYLVAGLEKVDSVLKQEVEVVLTNLGTKADFLNHNLGGVSLHLFLFLFLLIEKLLILNDFAYWRIRVGRDLNQIQTLIVSYLQCVADTENLWLHAFANQANHGGSDTIVNTMVRFFTNGTTTTAFVRLILYWCCYNFFSYIKL